MEQHCEDCKEPVESCGFGVDLCNSPERAEGIVNAEFASHILNSVNDPATPRAEPEDAPSDDDNTY